MLKADLHIHTCYSMDCDTPLEKVIAQCLKLNINCVAIADHGTVEGALELKRIAPFRVIVAEEILTPDGEIMGMFLSEEIPSNISADEAIARIREQNGLICIPHPYDKFRVSALKGKALERIVPYVDIIEVFNARTITPGCTKKARNLMIKYGKVASAGSDAHSPNEIGIAYVEMPEFNDKAGFLQSLAKGEIVGNKASPLVHFTSTGNKLGKRIFNKKRKY
jgi:predicted metal-dependent phosphoesterase TrpH